LMPRRNAKRVQALLTIPVPPINNTSMRQPF
jgi:hypothetical protein